MCIRDRSSVTLSTDRIERLEGLGLDWGEEPELTAWERCFMILQQYITDNGTADVPYHVDSAQYPRLGYWVTRQRQAYRVAQQQRQATSRRSSSQDAIAGSGKRINDLHSTSLSLDGDMIQQLEKIGFSWSEKTAWDKKFSLLRAYIEEFGHSSVPYRFATPKYPALGRWADVQKRHLNKRHKMLRALQAADNGMDDAEIEAEVEKQSLISAFQVQMLEAVGFKWGGRFETRWDQRYEEFCAYVDDYGSTRVKTALFPQLAAWANAQRRAWHHEEQLKATPGAKPDSNSPRISAERIAKLDKVGFEWVLTKWARKSKKRAVVVGGGGGVGVAVGGLAEVDGGRGGGGGGGGGAAATTTTTLTTTTCST